MIIYLIKSALCLLCLLIFYKFALENENMHRFKRFYLLASVMVAFTLPLFTFTYYTEAIQEPAEAIATTEFFEIKNVPLQKENPQNFNFKNYIPIVLWTLYGIGVAVFGFRLLHNLYEMRCKIRKNSKIRFKSHVKVLLEEGIAPHSFLKYIFVEKAAYKQQKIASEIIVHEKAHVKQKHSLDILFVELLQVIFWFNPLFLILKKQIRINHEFLADETVISKNVKPLHYSKLLFNYSAGINHSALSSPFNHLLIKKRIVMISKPFSKQRFIARLGFLVPVLAGCILLFNNDIVAKPILVSSEEKKAFQQNNGISISVQQENIFLNGKKVVLSEFARELDKITEGKTDAELKKLNFNLVSSNPERDLMKKLNEEYKKTRLASVKGNDLLPPVPPTPPKVPSVPPAPPAPPTPAEYRQDIKEELQKADSLKIYYEERYKKAEESREEMLQRMEERKKEMDARILEMKNRSEQTAEERQQLLEERRTWKDANRRRVEERKMEVEERQQEVEQRMKERRKKLGEKREEILKRETFYIVEDEKNPGASKEKIRRMGFLASKQRIDKYNKQGIQFFNNGKQISYLEVLQLQKDDDAMFIKLVEDENGKKGAHLFKTFKVIVEE